MNKRPMVLGVLDGFGYSVQTFGNAIEEAQTPTLDYLWSNYPHYLVKAAEEEVGLEFGEIGNSEVGHMTIGCGRVIPQSLNRINKSIEDGSFQQNPGILEAFNHVKSNASNLHLLGIVSTSGVHGHLFHFLEVLRMAANNGIKNVYLHLILDGRDAGKFDSPLFLQEIEKVRSETQIGIYASMTGRAFTMDRNTNWEKISKGYNVLFGIGEKTVDIPDKALQDYYQQNIDDENIPPTLIRTNGTTVTIKDNDALIFTNFREDRARQITQALSEPDFSKFERANYPKNFKIVTMTEYEKGLPVTIAFPPPMITNTLSDVLSAEGKTQIHIAETEKYAHVTYFFNGGREEKAPGEEFYLVKSLTPEEFADHPEMSAHGVKDAVLQALDMGYDFIVFNFANCDMVGHTGKYASTVKAIEIVDTLLKEIIDKVWSMDGHFLLTADHGNSEQMLDPKTNEIYKKHTIAPVPFIISGSQYYSENSTQKIMTKGQISGLLSDVAPTILTLMGISIPSQMTGASLV